MTSRSAKQAKRPRKRIVKDLPLKTASTDKTRGGGVKWNTPKTYQIISPGNAKP